jgi:hypothetical protein
MVGFSLPVLLFPKFLGYGRYICEALGRFSAWSDFGFEKLKMRLLGKPPLWLD